MLIKKHKFGNRCGSVATPAHPPLCEAWETQPWRETATSLGAAQPPLLVTPPSQPIIFNSAAAL